MNGDVSLKLPSPLVYWLVRVHGLKSMLNGNALILYRSYDDRGKVQRINVRASHMSDVFNLDCANQFGEPLDIVEPEPVGFRFNEKVGNLRVLLKSEDKAAGQIRFRDIEFFFGDRFLDDAGDFGSQSPNRAFKIFGRRADISNKPARIKPGARSNVAERAVSKPLLIA